MKLTDFRDQILELNIPCYHFEASKQTDKYIVWAEEGEGASSHADNQKTYQGIVGSLDYFTKEEYDSNFDAIQNKLNEMQIGWRLLSIQHEEDTKYIHYEWEWEI